MGNVVQGTLVLFFEAFAEIFGGDEAGFAISEVASVLFAKLHEGGVREANDAAVVVGGKFRVDGVAVAGGDAVPDVRELAVIDLAGKFGDHIKGADELIHSADIG